MPASYLAKHRPICDVLEELKELAIRRGDDKSITLCHEAIGYAKSMSNKLMLYKQIQLAVGYKADPEKIQELVKQIVVTKD